VSAPHAAAVNWEIVLLSVWAFGALALTAYWMVRWLRLRAAVRRGTPIDLDAPIEVKSCGTRIEPGVAGLFRPVLLLPEGIRERLSAAQMEAIVAHEMCHVRRRDNLTAAIHMVVEAMFWFHPLVWWIGARMIAEREAACDEAVISDGGDREAYAEALLTVCKFYVESPLDAAAGVAGADLKKRIERIMTPRVTLKLGAAKKLALGVMATATVVAPVAIASFFATPSRTVAQDVSQNPSVKSVSIRAAAPDDLSYTIGVGPDTFVVENYSLRQVIAWANDTESALVVGPDSLDAKYDIVLKASARFAGGSSKEQVEAAKPVIRNMLADQFQLQDHRATQPISGAYALRSGSAGNLPRAAWAGESGPNIYQGIASFGGTNIPMSDFLELLSWRLGHAVIDQTGFTGNHDFKVDWGTGTEPSRVAGVMAVPMSHPTPEVLANELRTQQGLILEPTSAAAEVLIVDHAATPRSLIPARTQIPMDPAAYDAYTGHYLFMGGILAHVYRDGAHLYSQPTGQIPIELFPEAPDEFFAKVVDVDVSFNRDASGRVVGLVLHQGGQDFTMPRLDEAAAEQMIDAQNARAQQKAETPGTEDALRQDLAGLEAGSPIYDRMSPELAKATRDHMPIIQEQFHSLGALRALKFTGVDRVGADIYVAEFEHGNVEYHISLAADGTIKSMGYRPVP
jgi:bla regulator protein blaR1